MKQAFFRPAALAAGLVICANHSGCAENEENDTKPAMKTAPHAPAQPNRPVKKSDQDWKKILTPEQYRILRRAGTEPPSGPVYNEFKHQGEGTYYCAGCGAELFSSKEKFDARCGWPSFFNPSRHKNIKTVPDPDGMRVEVRCNVCDGHLGHLFEGEGFNTPTDKRYCINGTVLVFVPKQKHPKPLPADPPRQSP